MIDSKLKDAISAAKTSNPWKDVAKHGLAGIAVTAQVAGWLAGKEDAVGHVDPSTFRKVASKWSKKVLLEELLQLKEQSLDSARSSEQFVEHLQGEVNALRCSAVNLVRERDGLRTEVASLEAEQLRLSAVHQATVDDFLKRGRDGADLLRADADEARAREDAANRAANSATAEVKLLRTVVAFYATKS